MQERWFVWRLHADRATIEAMRHQIESVTRAIDADSRLFTPDNLRNLPATPGAYILILRLGLPIDALTRQTSNCRIPPGWYFYAGSAHGRGGVRARVMRHFRRDKSIHWHIDRLSLAAEELAAVAVDGGVECNLVRRLLGSGRYRAAVSGFGNTDCRSCDSHLLTAAGN